jgi:hypothetical protein
MSMEALKAHCEDAHWGNRLKGFETILQRLTTPAPAPATCGDDDPSRPPAVAPLPAAAVEAYVDLAIAHLGDAHQRVAAEAMSVLGACVQGHTTHTAARLGAILSALFQVTPCVSSTRRVVSRFLPHALSTPARLVSSSVCRAPPAGAAARGPPCRDQGASQPVAQHHTGRL